MEYKNLSNEQQAFIDLALQGHNLLVDACIGSGKTTTIQCLCGMIKPSKRVLYLTYNKLLKADAQNRINSGRYTQVTNFHGFAASELSKYNIQTSAEEAILDYNKAYKDGRVRIPKCDVLILDEYQDIENEFAVLLENLKKRNPKMQIIAVGDMAQKIYDKTRLNVRDFIHEFLGESYLQVEFTKCFRLSTALAAKLGSIWDKKIAGVNPNCEVLLMTFREALEYLKKCEPKDVLCLGANQGLRNTMLNYLEKECSEKFNKFTVWSNIRDSGDSSILPDKDAAIFTTFDGCKGMERDICVVFDWSESYWRSRLGKPQTKYEVMRNVFCVAASRGKKKIIFVKANDQLGWDILKKKTDDSDKIDHSMNISSMFDFKYIEDVTDAYNQLELREISPKMSVIDIPTREGLIDLSPCIGIYQEVAYFDECSVDEYISHFFAHNRKAERLRFRIDPSWTLDEKVLFYVSLETDQDRYMKQVSTPLVDELSLDRIKQRLSTVLSPDATVQCSCQIVLGYDDEPIYAYGLADAVEDGIVYELKFVDELTHTHFLQCAMYMAALGIKKGILWNVKNNQQYEIRIPDMRVFLEKVVFAATKGLIQPCKMLPASSNTNIVVRPAAKKSGTSLVEKRPSEKRPPVKYGVLFAEFCDQNKKACKKVVQMSKKAKKENKSMGPVRLENAFNDMGIHLPFSARTFSKYWKEYCESAAKTSRKRKKKSA